MGNICNFLLAILGLGFLITFQIAKASEYVTVLKGEKKAFEQSQPGKCLSHGGDSSVLGTYRRLVV
jgi:hypothetical protein